ncbi:hypothetical protein Ngar_c29900 [Candidatus Nitrososphaera gargensis Ga9.2]|uniref:Uncharacterized protein n=1 Tax=Nitrososphaera gargensis (strain Ga9.2) TaxID=1237085 RepID=K0IKQ6_NITGG|nr:hypothetical protein [Candidatus Nitrososphaera gargensis]AFU59908.1 hypothetical protein Ngar_c29900 [Candidatus Nitrososphaera gargensis Ga9.2]
MYQSTIEVVAGKPLAYPSTQAFSIIVLTAAMLAVVSIALSVYLKRRLSSMSIPNLV